MEESKEQNRSFRMPMIEMIIIIGVFAIISVFLVQMFMGTYRLQKDATNLSKAVMKAESIAEEIKNTASIGEVANGLSMVACDNSSNNYCIYYDKSWNQTHQPSENIIIIQSEVIKGESGRMVNATISAYPCKDINSIHQEDVLITLTTKKWVSSK